MMNIRQAVFAVFLLWSPAVQAATIDTVLVGDAGNSGDVQPAGTFGAVAYAYRIGMTEVTNAQYCEFLNSVAAEDSHSLYSTEMGTTTHGGISRDGSPGNYTYTVKPAVVGAGPNGSDYAYDTKPVCFISWFDALRFANWLHNGQGNGDTETGAYTLLGGTPMPSNSNSIVRNPGAKWFLPSENEWYKAAYYDGVGRIYYDFPTGTDAPPDNNPPHADSGNSANYRNAGYTTGDRDYPLTDVGAYATSESPYGTFDQGGSLWEWNESLHGTSSRRLRGGAWNYETLTSIILSASYLESSPPIVESELSGFRVATIVAEPSSLALLVVAGLRVVSRPNRWQPR